ncbi:MAG: Stp1/IreP family PP2C-type Ser/Thr phosphatase [bacterium]
MPLKYRVIGKTDVGLVRPGNEDFLHMDHDNNVFAVCDGMGGHQAGEVASMTASATLSNLFKNFKKELQDEKLLTINQTIPPIGNILIKSIRLANSHIYHKAAADTDLSGMGTTIASIALHGDMMSVAHVGDSRVYRLEQRTLVPLTIDHSWVAEIQNSQNISQEEAELVVGKNVITRALGVRNTVEVDYRLVRVRPGDIFMLCSDGLCGFADDEDIFNIANKARMDLELIVDSLIQLAKDRGGADNITVIAIQIDEVENTDLSEIEVFTAPAENEEEQNIEKNWLDKLSEAEKKTEIPKSIEKDDSNKKLVTTIFILFIIVAVVIIYFSTMGK